MAKRSTKSTRRRRAATANANLRLLTSIAITPRSRTRLTIGSDRRYYSPPGTVTLKNYRRITKTLRSVRIMPRQAKKILPKALAKEKLRVLQVQVPFSPLCVRRKIRKSVMHAIGAAGSKVRKPKRNKLSNVAC